MATLLMMVLLLVLVLGMLTMNSITLRTTAMDHPRQVAEANARLALAIAIGRMQEEAGDDRRITADASILGSSTKPQLVGVWDSWSAGFAASPTQNPPDYDKEKTGRFRSWLVSGPEELTRDRNWGLSSLEDDSVPLFLEKHDGFDLRGRGIEVSNGRYAWAVSQENTKAKVNVAGQETDEIVQNENVALHVQPRPSLALSDVLKQPESDFNTRADALLSLRQIPLDRHLYDGAKPFGTIGRSYTVHSFGVLSNVVAGGLKTDLSLAIDMADGDFASSSWANPFRASGGASKVVSPASFDGERALFSPIVENPVVSFPTSYDPANLMNRLYAAGVPTFNHLRSFCRLPYYLYGDTPTVTGRREDHTAISLSNAAPAKHFFSPAKPPQGSSSQLSVQPVLNRAMFLFSARLASDDQVRLVMTPVIALWNPYNVRLDFEGGVVYPWMDLPFRMEWKFSSPTTGAKTYTVFVSKMMAKQWGRSIDPYFFCELTAHGDGQTSTPIRLEPGEVRMFSPAEETPVDFRRTASNQNRTIRMKPVENVQELNTRGGLSISMRNGVENEGFSHVMKQGDTVTGRFMESGSTGRFNYFVNLEDATRIKDRSDAASGQVISEIQTIKFASPITQVTSRSLSYSDLKAERQPFGVLETFQHVATRGQTTEQSVADLLYTTNPRQSAVCHLLAPGSFTAVPHYQSRLRPVSTFEGAIQTTADGQRAFWGGAQEPPLGRDQLPFFEIPQEPVLSLAALQHANLSSSAFSIPQAFANSWASPYLALTKTAKIDSSKFSPGTPVYDTSYLANEALWDEFFFSGISPRLRPGSSPGAETAWQQPNARTVQSTRQVLEKFVDDPQGNPLPNPRMHFYQEGPAGDKLVDTLLEPEGCVRSASHLVVDGAFNINSTDPDAWAAVLSGLRGQSFETNQGSTSFDTQTPFPRFRHPTGSTGDNWNGFRALSDEDIRKLAALLVEQVKQRGPFLSLSEFVNRRVEESERGECGAVQAAINLLGVNKQTAQRPFTTSAYPQEAQPHIIADSGVGIPGFLTQADVLQSLAPVITCRSDTFIIRTYGEATDDKGTVKARAWCEAVVQRTPNYVDPSDEPETAVEEVKPINQKFGRRFKVISFRRLHPSEMH